MAKKWGKESGRAFLILLIIIPLAPLLFFYGENNLRQNYIPYDFSKAVLDTVEPNGVLFAEGDTTIFDFLYLQKVEKYRPDIQVYDHLGVVYPNYYGYAYYKASGTADFLNSEKEKAQDRVILANIDKRPIYYLIPRVFTNHPEWTLRPAGLLYKVVKAKDNYSEPDYWSKYNIRGLDDPSVFKDFRVNELVFVYRQRYIQYLIGHGEPALAEAELKKIDSPEFVNSLETYNNIGLLYLQQGNNSKAVEYFTDVLKSNPNETAAYYNLALAEEATNKDQAIKDFDTFVLNWRDSQAYLDQAVVKLLELKAGAALTVEENNSIGLNYMNRGLYAKALEYFLTIQKTNPNIAGLYYNLGFTYQGLGQKAKATENYNKFLQLWPNNDNFKTLAEKALQALK